MHVRIGRGSGLRRPNDDGRGRPSIRIDHYDSGMHGVSTHIRVWLRFCMRMAPPTPRPVEVNTAGPKCVAEAVPMHRKDRGGYHYRILNRRGHRLDAHRAPWRPMHRERHRLQGGDLERQGLGGRRVADVGEQRADFYIQGGHPGPSDPAPRLVPLARQMPARLASARCRPSKCRAQLSRQGNGAVWRRLVRIIGYVSGARSRVGSAIGQTELTLLRLRVTDPRPSSAWWLGGLGGRLF